jgi:hypothetical protein
MPVSLPLRTPSGGTQLAAEQVWVVLLHTWLWQSLPWRQIRLSGQAGQAPPPQSTSVSVPLSTLSLQVAMAQVCVVLLQTWLRQSRGPFVQPWPAGHAGQAPPPQSIPVSVPLRTPSLQAAAVQVCVVGSQIWLRQSRGPCTQALPAMHGGQAPPPQSMSVSVPFCTPSVQATDVQVRVVLLHTWLWQSRGPFWQP